jgi:hypothetical protein
MGSLKWSSLMLLVGGWLRWQGDGSWNRLTSLLLGDCWECACSSLRLAWWGVLFSEARWSQMVSWSGWFPVKSSPTCSCRWLRCGLQNVPREHANCTPWDVRVNRAEASSWLKRLRRIFLLLSWGEPNIETASNNSCAITIVGYHGNSVY